MSRAGILGLLAAVLIVTGCTSAPTCEELAFYETAEGGKRIEAPDDLSNLAANREMVIPEASPRPARDLNAGCLDKPPTLRTSVDRAEEEAEEEEENEEENQDEDQDEDQ